MQLAHTNNQNNNESYINFEAGELLNVANGGPLGKFFNHVEKKNKRENDEMWWCSWNKEEEKVIFNVTLQTHALRPIEHQHQQIIIITR